MILSHCWCLHLAVFKFLFLFWNALLYEFLCSESSTLLHILIDVFCLSQVIFILKIFIDGCTFGAELLHQSVFSIYTHLRHFGCYWGKKTQHPLRQNANLLSYHVVASVILQFLWCELLELERTLILFLRDEIPYAFIISTRCWLYCKWFFVMAMLLLLFLRSVSIL